METGYIDDRQRFKALQRNQAFWKGELEEGPLMWVTVPGAKPSRAVPQPASEEELWTNVDYVIATAESTLSGTHYAGDALPVFCPWLGPDQFAAWLGAELLLRPRQSTCWSKPLVQDWSAHPELRLDPDNRWWRTYLQLLRESLRAGQGKWVIGYPDLHSGIDALSGRPWKLRRPRKKSSATAGAPSATDTIVDRQPGHHDAPVQCGNRNDCCKANRKNHISLACGVLDG